MRIICTSVAWVWILSVSAPLFAQDKTLAEAIEAYNSNDFERAALLFFETKQNDTVVQNRTKAEYYLGHSLYKMGLYQSALAHYNAVFVAGPSHPYYLQGAEGLINIAAALRDDTLIPSQINKYYNSQAFAGMNPMALSRINFYVGLLLYRQEKYGEALSFLKAVDPKSGVYAKALFLQAIIHTRLGVRYNLAQDEARTQAEYDRAIELFETTIDLSGRTAEKARQALDQYDDIQRLWQLCTLNLARSFYGKGDYAKAVGYYSRIPKFSQDWADALFENGWTFYMRQEYGKALGALHSLHSPRFSNLFHPESWILKATIYFQVCLYEESKAALAYFREKYEKLIPVLKQLAPASGGLPNEVFASLLLRDKLESNDPMNKVPAKVRDFILSNPRVENFRHFLRTLEAESKRLQSIAEWKGTRLVQELTGVVSVQRELLQKTAGGFVKANLKQAYQTVAGFVGHAKMIQLELTTKERQLIQAAQPIKAEQRGKLAPRPRVKDETYNYWRFATEYWQDELGYVEYTVRRACPESQ